MLKDLLRALGVSLAFLGLIELSLHLCGARFEASLFQMDPKRNYSFRPGASGWHTSENDIFVRINRAGNRDKERSFEPPPGGFRIAVLGSSTTAALEVEQQQTYTAILEQRLSRPGAPVEVLNFAVEGYGAAQDFYTLHDQVWRYHPQIVMDEVSLKQYVLNCTRKYSTTKIPYPYFQIVDGSAQPDDEDVPSSRPTSYQIRISNGIRDATNSSDLALLTTSAGKQLAVKMRTMLHPKSVNSSAGVDPRLDPWRWTLIPPPTPEIEQGWNVLEGLVALMRDESTAHGAEFWVVASDDAFQINPDPTVGETLRRGMNAPDLMYGDNRFEQFLSAKRVSHVHLEPALLEYVQKTHAYLHGGPKIRRGEGHWNALGHRVVAEILSRELSRNSDSYQRWLANSVSTQNTAAPFIKAANPRR